MLHHNFLLVTSSSSYDKYINFLMHQHNDNKRWEHSFSLLALFYFLLLCIFYSISIIVWRMALLLHFSAAGLYLKNNLSNEYNLMQPEHHNCTCTELTRLCWRNFIIEILIGLCGFLLYPCILSINSGCDLIAVNSENQE